MALTALHMAMSFILASVVLLVKPDWMPAVQRCKGNLTQLYKYLLPIGCFFACMLYGSNKAYLYCSVAFLQFMKEANVVLVFLFSALAGLQTVNRQRAVVIMWVIIGSSLCVSGELHFVFIGFLMQGISQLAECCRAVIAEIVLSGSEFKLDALSYTFFLAPVCLVVLVIGNICVWEPEVIPDAMAWWHCLLPNASIAFLLNLCIAQVIKETSAVGFMVTGMVKDICIVCFSCLVFHDMITQKQVFAFGVTLSGVFFWSLMKISPGHPLVKTFETLLMVDSKVCPGVPLESPKTATENTALVVGAGEKKV